MTPMNTDRPHKMGWLRDVSPLLCRQHPFVPGPLTAAPDWQPTTDPSFRVAYEGLDQSHMWNPPKRQTNSDCVAKAINAGLEYLVFKLFHKEVRLSDNFLYRVACIERDMGLENVDQGCYPQDALQAAFNWGVPLEEVWPNDPSYCLVTPTFEAYHDPRRVFLRAPFYYAPAIRDMQRALTDRWPTVFGIPIYSKFYFNDPGPEGILHLPESDERPIGGHYVLQTGYNRQKKAIQTRNSWGINWGNRGYFWTGYDYMDIASDVWTMTAVEAPFLQA